MKRARTAKGKEERRQMLRAAALDEFYENGFAAGRMEDIAQRAGCSKGTLYLYFDSKETLFRSLVESLTRDKVEQIETITSQLPSLETALEAFGQFAPKIIRESELPRLLKVLIGESQSFPAIVAEYREHILERILAAFARMLADAQARGEIQIQDPMLTARLIVAPVVLSGIWEAVFAQADSTPVDLDTLFRTHVRFLIKGMKPGD